MVKNIMETSSAADSRGGQESVLDYQTEKTQTEHKEDEKYKKFHEQIEERVAYSKRHKLQEEQIDQQKIDLYTLRSKLKAHDDNLKPFEDAIDMGSPHFQEKMKHINEGTARTYVSYEELEKAIPDTFVNRIRFAMFKRGMPGSDWLEPYAREIMFAKMRKEQDEAFEKSAELRNKRAQAQKDLDLLEKIHEATARQSEHAKMMSRQRLSD